MRFASSILFLTACLFLAAFTRIDLHAAPVLRQATGANAAAIQAAVDQFRADLGGANNGVGGSFKIGRREVNWDGVPDAFAEPNNLPGTFFNSNSPRGIVFTALETETGSALDLFAVSATSASGVPVRFGNLNPSYTTNFTTFSAQRLFIARNTPHLEVTFTLPGTKMPATVSGFGTVFTDVDSSAGGNRTLVRCYGPDNSLLVAYAVPAFNNGLSFAAVTFNAGERIARVMIECGNAALSSVNNDGVGGLDLVATDDFIFAEPQPLQLTNNNGVLIDTTVPLKFTSLTMSNAPAGFVNATLQCSPHHTYRIFSSTNLIQWTPAIVTGAAAPDQNLFDPRPLTNSMYNPATLAAPLQLSREGKTNLFYRAIDQSNNDSASASFTGQ